MKFLAKQEFWILEGKKWFLEFENVIFYQFIQ